MSKGRSPLRPKIMSTDKHSETPFWTHLYFTLNLSVIKFNDSDLNFTFHTISKRNFPWLSFEHLAVCVFTTIEIAYEHENVVTK